MSDSNSSRRFQHGIVGPRGGFYPEGGHGFDFNLMSYEGSYGKHKLSVKALDLEAGVHYEKDNVRAFLTLSTLGVGYESPDRNFKPNFSHSYGAGIGLKDDHVNKTSTLSISPPKRKEAVEFTLTHPQLKHISETTFAHEDATNNPFV